MTKPQIIKSPSGEEMVVMPLVEYKTLIEAAEDAEDARVAKEALAAIAAGEDEMVPFELAARLIGDEHPVSVWRKYRLLKVGELAVAAGISQGYLSQIESGKRRGTISTMRELARALKVDVEDLLPDRD